jgi:PAS domain S-box-containing protein
MIKKDPMVKRAKPKRSPNARPKIKAAVIPCSDVILDNISDNIIQLDPQNRVTWANQAAVDSLGRKAQDILGQQCYKLWGRTSADCRDCPTVLARRSGTIQSKEMASKDGRIWQVTSHPILDDKGRVASVVEVSRDITESKGILDRENKLLHDKGAISEVALQLAKTSEEEQIFKLISLGIHKLAGNSVAIVSSYDSTDSSLTVREVVGSSASLKKINQILGKKAGLVKFKNISPKIVREFRLGRLMSLRGGLAEAAFGGLSARIINALSAGLGIQQVYGMGLYCGQNILGAIAICQLDKKIGLNQDLIENFINQAAMALSRVKAEKEIKYSQDYFKAIIDNTSEIITIIDSDGIIKFKSRSAALELGYQPEELIGRNVFDFIHPEDVPGLIAKFNHELHNAGKKIRLEIRFSHKNGTWQTLDATSINLMDNPSVNGLVISSRNITHRKENELALRLSEAVLKESEEKHRVLLESIHSPILALDRDLVVLYCNQGYFDIIGKPEIGLVGKKILEVYPSFQKTNSYQAYLKCLGTGMTQRVEGKFSGRYLKVTVYPTQWGLLAVADDDTETHAVQEQLEESRRKLETLMGNLPGMVYRCRNDRQWTMEITNEGCLELTGYDQADIIANQKISYAQLIHPSDREMVWDEIQNAVQKKEAYQLIYRIIARDGAEKWVWEQGQGIYDEKGILQALEGFITDISERKRAEDALHVSEYQYRSTIDSLADSIHVVDAKLSVMLTNRVFKEWNKKMGLASEAVGRNIFDIYPYLRKDSVSQEYQTVFQTGKVMVTVEENSINNSRVVTESRKIPIFENDKVVRVITVVRDITDRKLAEEKLHETEEMYRGLIEATDTGFVIIDGAGRVLDANQEYVRLTGHSILDEILGRPVTDWTAPHDLPRNRSEVEKCHREGSVRMLEIDYQHRDGTIIPVEINATVVQRADSPVIMTLCRDITARKLAEEKLRETETRLTSLSDNIPNGLVYQIDSGEDGQQRVFTYISAGVEHLHGVTVREVMEDAGTIYGQIAEEDREMLAEREAAAVRQMASFSAEVRMRMPSGITRWSLFISSPRRLPNNHLLWDGVEIDITESKLSQEKLRESEANYRALFDQASDGIMFMSLDGSQLIVNDSFARMHGYGNPSEMQHIRLADLDTPETAKLSKERLRRMIAGESLRFEVEHFHKDGHRFPLQVSCSVIRIGEKSYFLGFHQDITESKLAQEKLKESEANYRQIFDGVTEGIFRSTPEGRVLMANPALARMLGYSSAEELMQRDIAREGYNDVKIRQRFLDQIEKNGSVSNLISEWRRKDGSAMVSNENAHAVRDPSGNTLYYEGTVEDITEKSRAEESLRTSEYQYRTTIDSLGDAIHVVDRDLKIILSNRVFIQWCHDLNLGQEVLNKDIFELCPFLNKRIREEYETVFNTKKVLVSQENNEIAGKKITTETRKVPVIENDRVIRVITVMRDITEQKLAEEEIRSSELKYRMLMDQANDAIFIGDPETGRLVDANLKAQQLVGRGLEEIVKMHQTELHPADQKEKYQEIFRQHVKNGKAILRDMMVMHKDGHQIPVEISANLVEIKGRKLLQGIFHDLSERQGMESALKESEEKYRQIFEGISEGIYRSTPDGKLLFANPSLIRMLGYKNPEDVQGLDLNHSVYLDKKTRERFISQIEQNGEVMGFEAELRSKDGTVLAVSENARLIKDQSGKPLYYEGTLEDVTVRKRAELSLKGEKDKLEHLFKVGLSVARAQTLQEKLDLTLKGIADCRLFRKAVIVLEDNGYRSHIAQYGLQPEEVENIEKSPVNDAQQKSRIFLNKYRKSNSYFIPHSDAEVHKYFAARFVNQDYKPNGTWHREDVLIVPLAIKGANVGYLSVDEPWDGNIPGIETVHLLELFANQAAIAIENIRLYNDLERSYYDTLKAFVAAMDAKDPYTKGHSENVRHYALKIARHIGLPEDKLRLVDYSSLLHDIGKLGIREDILAKPDVLSTAEFQEVKLHPVIGSRLVLEIDALSHTGEVIYCHHEYYDGSGYPRGIKGDDIPLEARIIAVADAFEAMTSDRPYRKAFSFQVALQRLQDSAGTQFDHKIVNAFTDLFRRESGIKEGD